MPLKVLAIFNWSCCFVHFAKLYLIWISSLIWLISVLMWVSIVLSFSPNILLLWSSNLSISFSIFVSSIFTALVSTPATKFNEICSHFHYWKVDAMFFCICTLPWWNREWISKEVSYCPNIILPNIQISKKANTGQWNLVSYWVNT